MVEKPKDYDKPNPLLIDEKCRRKRREHKKDFNGRFVKGLQHEKARILKFRSHQIMEEISDDVRQRLREFYDTGGDFHRYLEEFEGGTIMVLWGEAQAPGEFLVEKEKLQHRE
jgi:hypothetical protein